jgi:hypothetical protein
MSRELFFRRGQPVAFRSRKGRPMRGMVITESMKAHVPVALMFQGQGQVQWVPRPVISIRKPDPRDDELRRFIDTDPILDVRDTPAGPPRERGVAPDRAPVADASGHRRHRQKVQLRAGVHRFNESAGPRPSGGRGLRG